MCRGNRWDNSIAFLLPLFIWYYEYPFFQIWCLHDETSRTTIQPSTGKMIVLNSSHYEEHLVYIEIKTTTLSVTLSVILWNASISILLLHSRTDVISRRFSSDPRLNFMTKKKKWSYQLTPVIFPVIFMHHHEKSDDFTEQHT